MILLAIAPLWVLDLTSGDGSLLATGDSAQWEWGEASSGPSGATAWGTQLDGNYRHNAEDSLEILIPPLTSLDSPTLTLRHWYQISVGDVARFEVDDGSGWDTWEPVYGYPVPGGFYGGSDGWIETHVDLSDAGNKPRVRMNFVTDGSTADDGWFLEQVRLYDGDPVPPWLELVSAPTDTQDLDGPYTVTVEAGDDRDLVSLDLVWDDGTGERRVLFVATTTDVPTWEADIAGAGPDTTLSWYAEAWDGTNLTRLPAADQNSFRVYLAAPTHLTADLQDRAVAQSVDLAWEAPDSPHSIRHYNLRLGGEVVDSTTDTEGTIELVDDDRLVSVAAVYDIHGDLIAGDLSESEFLRVEVPALQTVSPTSGWAGDTLRVTVQGSGLYLLDEHSELDFGPEITVSDLRVLDVDRAGATLSIGADAPVGPVTLWVTGAQGSFEFPAAFEVLDASEAPQIVSVKPGKLVQGDHADVVFEASEAFGSSVVVVDAGDHLVPGEVVMVDGNTVTVELTALGRSSVGEHVVILDDGFRTWTAPFEIVEYVTPTTTGCQHGGGSGSWLGLGLMALVMRRRGTPDAGPETRGATGR